MNNIASNLKRHCLLLHLKQEMKHHRSKICLKMKQKMKNKTLLEIVYATDLNYI